MKRASSTGSLADVDTRPFPPISARYQAEQHAEVVSAAPGGTGSSFWVSAKRAFRGRARSPTEVLSLDLGKELHGIEQKGGGGAVGSGCCAFGTHFVAALWDLWRSALLVTGMHTAVQVVDIVDGMLRTALALVSVMQVADFWLVRAPVVPEVDEFSVAVWVVLAACSAMYVLERTAGRFRKHTPGMLAVEDTLLAQLVTRRPFRTALSGLMVLALHLVVAISITLVSATHLGTLASSTEAGAVGFLVLALCADVFYSLARMSRFQQVATQSRVALHVAGVHTFVTFMLHVPLSVVYLVLAATRPTQPTPQHG